MRETRLDLGRIRAARRVIDPVFLDTPLFPCDTLGTEFGCSVSVKLETANPVRSFKARGTELVASLLAGDAPRAAVGSPPAAGGGPRASVGGPSAPVGGPGGSVGGPPAAGGRPPAAGGGPRGAVCASAGNLGQALAWSGRRRGLDVTVVASRHAPATKLDRIRAFGARLELVDGDFERARERAADIARRQGIRLVEDSLDIETCEGAATIGLELAEAAPPFDAVLVALGGGAMATGVGYVLKALSPGTEVICVQPEGAPAMTLSWRRRRVVTTETTDTIADGVAGRRPIPAVLDDLLQVADDAVLVQEASIIAGMRLLLEHAGLIVEPSAALGVAALLENRDRFAGRRVATIVCGSNVDLDAHHHWTRTPPQA